MNVRRSRSSIRVTTAVPSAVATGAPLPSMLLGVLCVAAVAVLSLPQARGANIWIGWWPFWLLVAPGCSVIALRCRVFAESRRLAPPTTRFAVRRECRGNRGRQARRPGRASTASLARLASAG